MSADESITSLSEAVAELGALPMPVPVGPEPQEPALSGPVCSQAEARAAGLDIAPSVEELDAMAESVVALGDPLSAEVSLALAVPLLGAAVTGLRARVAELEAERHSTNEALDDAVQELRRRETGPALPWAHAMSDHDLHGFLDDLVSAAMGRWRSEPEVPDREVLADIEKVCAAWRTPGLGLRLDGSEFDGAVVRLAPSRAVPDAAPLFSPVASLREPEGEFHAYLHHENRVGHDLPETGGESRG